MKRLLLLAAAIAGACGLAACASEEGWPSTEEVSEKLQRGVSGQGQLGPIDRGNDPNLRDQNESETHP